ncbi:hypothetical protein M3Y99_00511800 [Aphelenchoides fujianensis]|nr:hypothetical protein M3Y99_00511800 [Aphelenchoides fujianensis]
MEHRIEINLDRCLCIHSLLQMLDLSLQAILYDRRIIPEPYHRLKGSQDTKGAQKFCDAYEKLTKTLQSTFRSYNRELIEEIVLILGNTPFAPAEIFRIDVKPCAAHGDSFSDDFDPAAPPATSQCVDICGQLSPKERREVSMSVAFPKLVDANQPPRAPLGKLAKGFLMLRTNGKLLQQVEGLELDDSYALPPAEQVQRLGIRTTRIGSRKCPTDEAADAEVGAIWHRFAHVISSV